MPEQNNTEKSGTFLVRVPKMLHSELARQAADEGISLNQYVNTILAAAAREHKIEEDARDALLRIGAREQARQLAHDTLEPARRSIDRLAGAQREALDAAQRPAREAALSVARLMQLEQEAFRSAVAAALPADLVRKAIAAGTADALEAARAAARPPDPRDYLAKRKPASS